MRALTCRLALTTMLLGGPSLARADQVSAEQEDGEQGYIAIEELSYEAIIEASDGYSATLRIRTALHNASLGERDVVASLALPATSQLRGIRVARDGKWADGMATIIRDEPARRDPGAVFARALAPAERGGLPAAELVAFGLEASSTIQVELTVAVYPRLRGNNWELDLPARGHDQINLARDRRVLVKGLRKDEPFWCEETSNRGKPYIVTSSRDGITAKWPAHLAKQKLLEGHYELTPGPAGFDDGEFRLYLRLGQTAPPRPDHVVLAVDRSLSTSSLLQGQTHRMFTRLLDDLPSSTTFDALGFSRRVEPLLPLDGRAAPKVGDAQARNELRRALDANEREAGTDLVATLVTAIERSKAQRAKRPMIMVVTDGMLPISVDPEHVRRAFDKAVGRRGPRPEVLFVVDDPLLVRSGLDPSHPMARIAAALGARISLETVGQLQSTADADVLAAPRVMGELQVVLPENMVLDHPPPSGLVAGNFALLTGHYVGKPAAALEITGSFDGDDVARRLRADEQERLPQALAAAIGGPPDEAASEGFVRPPWYAMEDERTARQGIVQASRGGFERKGYLDRKIFRHYLTTRVLPRARVCYNHALIRDPAQAGRAVLHMEVAKGEVMLASTGELDLQSDDAKFVACLGEAAWALDIPAGKLDDKIYVLRYPLRLVPPEDGKQADVVEGLSEDQMMELLAAPAGSASLASVGGS
ncbi:MAG: VWA domain-containing protein [Myxococcales bacterium]|nr:VWA domain-containing protein [Myxococcales bacterium]